MENVVILGSTGSIGRTCLEIIDRHRDKYKVVGLACNDNTKLLNEQISMFDVKYAYAKNKNKIKGDINILDSLEEFCDLEHVDSILFATVGFTSFKAVLKAINNNKKILLANKETLVCGGDIIMSELKKSKAIMLPVDSEHSAIMQCMSGDINKKVRKITLTASGGAFRNYTKEQLEKVTYKDALKHPNWDMGSKITVDSASLVNKALEVIEAKHLFDISFSKIDYVLHKESIIHSMIELYDSSTIAQLSYPTMEIPISLALSYPNRHATSVKNLDLASLKTLTFDKIDKEKYPCFDVVLKAGLRGGIMPTIVNAANEVLVESFKYGEVSFVKFADVLSVMLNTSINISKPSVQDILEADIDARIKTSELISTGKYL